MMPLVSVGPRHGQIELPIRHGVLRGLNGTFVTGSAGFIKRAPGITERVLGDHLSGYLRHGPSLTT